LVLGPDVALGEAEYQVRVAAQVTEVAHLRAFSLIKVVVLAVARGSGSLSPRSRPGPLAGSPPTRGRASVSRPRGLGGRFLFYWRSPIRSRYFPFLETDDAPRNLAITIVDKRRDRLQGLIDHWRMADWMIGRVSKVAMAERGVSGSPAAPKGFNGTGVGRP